MNDFEFPEKHHFLHLFRYDKIRHKGYKHNSFRGFMGFMKIGAGCAFLTGISEITFMGVVREYMYSFSLHCRKSKTWVCKDQLGLLPKFLNF